MREASVGFQCPECIKEATRSTRQNRALFGGERSSDPRLTSYVLIGINLVVWVAILATGGGSSRLADLLALRPNGACVPGDGYVRTTSRRPSATAPSCPAWATVPGGSR